MTNPRDLDALREKLDFLEEQEISLVDSSAKFKLRKEIDKARRRIAELTGDDTSTQPLPRATLADYHEVARTNATIEKLAYLEHEIAVTADPGRKFELHKQIVEARRAIAELQSDEQPKQPEHDLNTNNDYLRYLIDEASRYRGAQFQILAARICIVSILWLPILLANTIASLTSVILYSSALLYVGCEFLSIRHRLNQARMAIAQIEGNEA